MPLISSLGVMNAINFGMASSLSAFKPIAFAGNYTTNPKIKVYDFTSTNGFGGMYSQTPNDNVYDIVMSPDNKLIVDSLATNQVVAYPWVSGVGSGTALAGRASTPGQIQYTVFNKTGDTVAIGHNTTPFISVYPINNSTGFDTKYTNPTTLPAGNNGKPAFNSTGTVLAVGQTSTPFINAYIWSNGFGTKYANPATLPTGTIKYTSFNFNGSVLAMIHDVSPFITTYSWSNGFGTKYANPAIALTSGDYTVQFNNTGTEILAGCYSGVASGINVYTWSNGFGTKYADAVGLTTTSYQKFNSNSTSIIYGLSSSPFVGAIRWVVGTGFGAKYSNPSSPPVASLSTVGFSN